MENEIKKALEWRYATKQFDKTKKLSTEDFDTLLNSLRMAPSSFGLQPYKFLIINDIKIREKLKSASWNQSPVSDASHLIVLCAKTDIDEKYIKEYIELTAKTRGMKKEDLKGFEEMLTNYRKGVDKAYIENWNKKQVYIALGFLMETAALMGIDTTPMEGFNPKEVDEILNLKEKGLTAAVLCSIGYRADSDKYSKLAKVRLSKENLFEII